MPSQQSEPTLLDSPCQNVPSTPSCCRRSESRSMPTPVAIVPELTENSLTPAPSPFVDVRQCMRVPSWFQQVVQTPRGQQLRDLDLLPSLICTPLTKPSPLSDHVVPNVVIRGRLIAASPRPPLFSDQLTSCPLYARLSPALSMFHPTARTHLGPSPSSASAPSARVSPTVLISRRGTPIPAVTPTITHPVFSRQTTPFYSTPRLLVAPPDDLLDIIDRESPPPPPRAPSEMDEQFAEIFPNDDDIFM